jgi:hypothetical protein
MNTELKDESNTEFAPDVNLAATSDGNTRSRATRDGLTAKPSEEGARQPTINQATTSNQPPTITSRQPTNPLIRPAKAHPTHYLC